MAETKRQNTGGKVPVATPNIGPQGMVSMEAALCGAIGARIRLQTTIPAHPTLEGTVYTASPAQNILAVTTSPPTAPQPSYHLLSLSSIQSFTLLSLPSPPPSSFTAALPSIAPLDTPALLSRLESTVARLKAEDARRGKGVSSGAQEIFNAISRTLQTRWEGTSIVVMDTVVIGAPYRPEDCKAGAGAAVGALARVKKMLEMERKKLADKAGNKPAVPTVVPTSGPRKGG